MTEKQLNKTIEETLGWAHKMSEEWVGTTAGDIINYHKKHLEYLIESNYMDLASVQVLNFAKILHNAEKELNGYS